MSTIMVYVVVLRLFALGLISGGVMAIPFIGDRSGSDVNHVRLDALIMMNLFQLVTVPLGLLIGILLAFMRSWARPPGYVMAAATIVFGVVVATQAWAVVSWAEGRPPGIGDPDGEVGLGVLNVLGGAFTILVGVSIASMRWAGWRRRISEGSGMRAGLSGGDVGTLVDRRATDPCSRFVTPCRGCPSAACQVGRPCDSCHVGLMIAMSTPLHGLVPGSNHDER